MLNKAQANAVETFRSFIEQRLENETVTDLRIADWTLDDSRDGLAFVCCRLECGPAVPANSLLRLAAAQYWNVAIHNRGRITVASAPKQYAQFKGKRVFGLNFK